MGSSFEPTIDLDNYNISLSAALNYYNDTLTLAEYKTSALDFADSIGKSVPKSIPEFDFRSIGAVCRLIMREQPIKAEHIQQIVDKLAQLTTKHQEIVSVKQESKPVVQKIKEDSVEFQEFMAELEDVFIDAIIHKWKNIQEIEYFVTKFAKNQFSRDEISRINSFLTKKYVDLTKVYDEYKSNSTCEQFKEAWKNIPSTRIKKAMAEITELQNALTNIVKVEKKVKFTAKKKEKPALSQVKNIQFAKNYENYEGLHPKSVIGSTEVWIFDTETRDLTVLRAIQGTKFEAEGQSFRNIDQDKSYKKKLRKPVEQLNSFINCVENKTKKLYKELFEAIKSTEQKGTGRMSETRMILHVFK